MRSVCVLFKYARIPTVISLALRLLQSIETPLSIFFTGALVNGIGSYITNPVDLSEVIFWTAALLAVMLFSSNSTMFTGLMDIYIHRALNRNLTKVVLDKMRVLDYVCFEDTAVLNTLERMGSEPHKRIFHLYNNTVNAVATFISLVGTAIVFTRISVWFAAVYFALLCPLLWFDYKSIEARQRLWNTDMPNWRRRTYLSALLADKHAEYELKTFGAIDFILAKWKKYADDFRLEYVRMRLGSSKYGVLHVLTLSAWAVFVILSMVSGLSAGTVTIGAFVACVTSMSTVLNRSSAMSGAFSQVSQEFMEMKHFEIFMALPEIRRSDDNALFDCRECEIVFEDVHFSYPNSDKPVLRNVSFEILPGERAAIVGENGAGKSTLIKLLCGLYKPGSGSICVNDVSVSDLSAAQLRSALCVVFQDFCGYEFTLRENVALGNIEKINDDIVLINALKSGLWDENIPLDTNLGRLEDDGTDLSGGQWQKIALARAMAGKSPFIILDEPTASLDPLAESRMYESFQSVLKDRGCVMISHRLAGARLADKIIVLDGGSVAQIGTHEELMTADGLYREMFTAQIEWYNNYDK